MRKIISAFLILAAALFFAGTSVVKAGGCTGTCAAWNCINISGGGQNCTCTDILVIGGNQALCDNKVCGSGYYVCNDWAQGRCCPTGSGGGGGGGNYYVHDGCSPHGLILKCGTPDPAQFACKNSQGGVLGRLAGPGGATDRRGL